MSALTYYCGTIPLKSVYGLDNAKFLAIGGVKSKHNRYDSFRRLVGHPATGFDAVMPVTRRIEFKSNPSLHKCDARCQNATGHVCECSCHGEFHGAGNS